MLAKPSPPQLASARSPRLVTSEGGHIYVIFPTPRGQCREEQRTERKIRNVY